jgi:hypothetical protein
VSIDKREGVVKRHFSQALPISLRYRTHFVPTGTCSKLSQEASPSFSLRVSVCRVPLDKREGVVKQHFSVALS